MNAKETTIVMQTQIAQTLRVATLVLVDLDMMVMARSAQVCHFTFYVPNYPPPFLGKYENMNLSQFSIVNNSNGEQCIGQ